MSPADLGARLAEVETFIDAAETWSDAGYRLGQLEQLTAQIQQAAALDPSPELRDLALASRLMLADLLCGLDDDERAVGIYAQILAEGPGAHWGRAQRGLIGALLATGATDRALAVTHAALLSYADRSPDHREDLVLAVARVVDADAVDDHDAAQLCAAAYEALQRHGLATGHEQNALLRLTEARLRRIPWSDHVIAAATSAQAESLLASTPSMAPELRPGLWELTDQRAARLSRAGDRAAGLQVLQALLAEVDQHLDLPGAERRAAALHTTLATRLREAGRIPDADAVFAEQRRRFGRHPEAGLRHEAARGQHAAWGWHDKEQQWEQMLGVIDAFTAAYAGDDDADIDALVLQGRLDRARVIVDVYLRPADAAEEYRRILADYAEREVTTDQRLLLNDARTNLNITELAAGESLGRDPGFAAAMRDFERADTTDDDALALTGFAAVISAARDTDDPELRLLAGRARYQSGVLHQHDGDHRAAINHFTVAAHSPTVTDERGLRVRVYSLVGLGLSLTRLDRTAEAIDAFTQALGQRSVNGDTYVSDKVSMAAYQIAVLQDGSVPFAQTIAAYERVITLALPLPRPGAQLRAARAMINLALTHQEAGNPPMALMTFERLVTTFGGSADTEVMARVDRAGGELLDGVARLDATAQARAAGVVLGARSPLLDPALRARAQAMAGGR